MFKHSVMAMVTLAALSAAGPVRAASGTDTMLCEARRMRCDSKEFDCLGRCGNRATSAQTDCTRSCVTRAKQLMDRIERNPPCAAGPVTASPETCEARLLRVGAADLVCDSRCTSRAQGNDAFDLGACLQTCQTRCDTAVDDTLSGPTCANGRVGTDPVCAAD